MDEPEEGVLTGSWDRVLALLLALPAAVLAWAGPGSPLAGDLYPEATGTGLAVLLALPAGVLLVLRRAAPRVAGLFVLLGFIGVGLLSLRVSAPSDTLEADRATMIVLVGLLALLGGASLGRLGRAWFARALVAIAILLLVPALLESSPGALQNSGATSEAALPGAVAGGWLAARGRGAWAWLGGIAAGLEALFAGVAPVLAGALCLVAVLAVGCARGRRRVRFALLAGACAAIFAVAWGLRVQFDLVASPASAPTTLAAHPDLRGFDVRRRVWSRTLSMTLDHGALGVGPGQFAAAFPPYRDPLEQRASDAPLSGQETEVEHAHNDWLQGAAETGAVGGLLWALFLALALARGLRALSLDVPRAALGGAAVALLLNALVRSPLLFNPASATLAFATFGAVLARPAAGRPVARRAIVLAALVALGLQAARARALNDHGRALSRIPHGEATTQLALALTACPDSVLAHSLSARYEEARARHAAAAREWERVLTLRPHRFEALVQLGRLHANERRDGRARALWTRAHALSPEHPAVLHNLARVEGLTGNVDAALEWAERGGLDAGRLTLLGFDVLVLRGDVETAFELMQRGDVRLAGLNAARAFELAGDPPEELAAHANHLKGAAQLLWAREHVAQGDLEAAVRSYRQARAELSYRLPEVDEAQLAPAVRMELAAALVLTERGDEARRELQHGPRAMPRDLAALPSWAGNALLSAGLLGTHLGESPTGDARSSDR